MKRSGWQNRNNRREAPNLREWLSQARQALHSLPDEPSSSIYALAANVLDKPAYWPQAHPECPLTATQLDELNRKLTRLLNGKPLAYITCRRSFYDLDFYITPNVLVPRPETELMVESAIDWLAPRSERGLAADIGTGSGGIAVCLAYHLTGQHVVATDLSFASLRTARKNVENYHLDRQIHLVQADLLQGIRSKFSLICANLPYIPTHKLASLEAARHEPVRALDGGADGLDLIRRLLAQARTRIEPGGLILLEMEFSQSEPIKEAIRAHFPGAGITITNDLNNLPRLVKIEVQKH
jgi:release factor glutamine methyltransferase